MQPYYLKAVLRTEALDECSLCPILLLHLKKMFSFIILNHFLHKHFNNHLNPTQHRQQPELHQFYSQSHFTTHHVHTDTDRYKYKQRLI